MHAYPKSIWIMGKLAMFYTQMPPPKNGVLA